MKAACPNIVLCSYGHRLHVYGSTSCTNEHAHRMLRFTKHCKICFKRDWRFRYAFVL